MNDDEQLRFSCLSEAVRAFGGTGIQTPDLVSVANKFYEFVKGADKRRWTTGAMLGFLAQAYDEAVPDGASGFVAANAIADFMKSHGFAIVLWSTER